MVEVVAVAGRAAEAVAPEKVSAGLVASEVVASEILAPEEVSVWVDLVGSWRVEPVFGDSEAVVHG